MHVITSASESDLLYSDFEVGRHSGAINRDFIELDGSGPIETGIEIAKEHGRVALLDAGCGTGYGLADMKHQISFRAPATDDSIVAHGISLSDVRSQFDGNQLIRERLTNGYITMILGNLASLELQPAYYDVAYSYEVLMHNEVVAPILGTVVSSLRAGGVYYFNSLSTQSEEVEDFVASYSPTLRLQSEFISCNQIDGMATRSVHKVSKDLWY